MKIVYQTNAAGLFVGEVLADESPLEPGAWLIPGGCSEEPPPQVGDGEVARLIDGAWVVEAVPAAPTSAEPDPIPASITRRQCAAEMFARGMITGAEAVAMTATATPPAMIEAELSALSEPDQTFARIDFAAGSYARGNTLLVGLMTALGETTETIDSFFRFAALR